MSKRSYKMQLFGIINSFSVSSHTSNFTDTYLVICQCWKQDKNNYEWPFTLYGMKGRNKNIKTPNFNLFFIGQYILVMSVYIFQLFLY